MGASSIRLLAATLSLTLPVAAAAQAPAPTVEQITDAAAGELTVRPGEAVLLTRLDGIVFRPSPEAVSGDGPRHRGYDVTAVPLLQAPDFATVPKAFLGRPASLESIRRLALATRLYLSGKGYPLVAVFAPEQVIDGNTVQIVVRPSQLDAIARVEGARHFTADHYLRALRQAPGEPIRAAQLAEDIAWLNRQPFHQVTATLEPGTTHGTTALVLHVQERRPLSATTGYDNTGTPATGQGRLFAGISWGNLFGRGDLVSYQFRSDPRVDHVVTHSLSYGSDLPWRHTLTVAGAWTRVTPTLPEPFDQAGTSWQAGLQYGVPIALDGRGWEGTASLTADFKVSDNTIEFAAVPVIDNVTHIVQAGLAVSLSRSSPRRQIALSATFNGSPGGVTSRNTDEAFHASRFAADARYAYGRLMARYAARLPRGLSTVLAATAQRASGPLLGTEQLNGAGSSGVRGYQESTAFADEGLIINAELHLPAFSMFTPQAQGQVFAFLDGGLLHARGPGGTIGRLASAGLGARWQLGGPLGIRAAWGWPLRDAPGGGRAPHGHVGVHAGW